MKIDLEKIKKSKTTEELLEFGIINIDKSSGPSSFNISDFVRKTLKIRKTSHFGTLDPKVTGVLPVALNRACKLTGFFIGEQKEYIGIMRIHEEIPMKNIQEIINKDFIGNIMQLPPVKSRVKRAEREREIKTFKLLEQDGKDFLFHSEVQGGTYIRKLIHDLGEKMKIGAHMLELRRTRAGIFKEGDKNYPSVNLYDFEKAVQEYQNGNDKPLRKIIIPGEIVTELYPSVDVHEKKVQRLFVGKPLHYEDLKKQLEEEPEKGERIIVFSGLQFIGIYSVIGGKEILAKGEFIKQPIR